MCVSMYAPMSVHDIHKHTHIYVHIFPYQKKKNVTLDRNTAIVTTYISVAIVSFLCVCVNTRQYVDCM